MMEVEQQAQIANQLRCDVVSMITKAGSGHPGGSLSSIEILTSLYFSGLMNHDPKNPHMPERDRFILSKGHAAPALYAVLARAGYFSPAVFPTLRQPDSILQGHPDSSLVPGVEVSTGSLGQGLSISAGMAAGLKLSQSDSTVFTLLGDGECQEGQVWEAAMFAAHQKLDNLIAIVDRNDLQIDGKTSDVCDLGNLSEKFESFGWNAYNLDGHDLVLIHQTLSEAKAHRNGKPTVIVAHTVKGKGVSFMEHQAGWHGKAPNEEQCESALAELQANK